MKKFDYMEKYGYEQLVYFHDRNTGLKGAICIHNTVLGPALGGTRLWKYEDEDDAILDVLRLARGMTYKAACAGLNLGGGKAVIIGDSKELRKDTVRREAFWRAFGRYVESLNGRYITAEDVGTCTADMDYIHCETTHVTGLSGTSGDPSPLTAYGVYKGLKAAVKEAYGSAKLDNKVVAIQGLGNVGYHLAKHLHADGAKLIVCDMDPEKVAKAVLEFGATAVELNDIYDVECDVYAPCALGATVNDDTLSRLKCKVIAGAANNVLKDPEIHGQMVHDLGIIYAPDYVINAGGLINVYQEIQGYNYDTVIRNVDLIFDRIREIVRTSIDTNRPTYLIADEFAERRIEMMKNVQSIHLTK